MEKRRGRPKGLPRTGGRQKGTPNKITQTLKEAILESFGQLGGAAYLKEQAAKNPGPYMVLLGKVLPTTIAGDPNAPIVVTHIELIGVEPK